ncbi:hypothetical protein KUTeg_017198 [Tegillarca granosa]|uniref:Uncharacterized protein n=1 Tax=Tegillarca granosa TaxID=220873 RepID=A0ABQ9EN38_TEGGR|nr:hypothetical protein KUTeg_017198 [Tegillarca granosa]
MKVKRHFYKTDSNSNDMDRRYKRVAIVEDFFDIIYGVHVEMDGRGGKHAGQKRTYRAQIRYHRKSFESPSSAIQSF